MKNKEIHQKLFHIQQEMKTILKTSKVDYKTKDGRRIKYEHYNIHDLMKVLKPLLEKYRVLLTQPLRGNRLYTIFTCIEEGEEVKSWMNITYNRNPQDLGSEITYYRRYALSSVLAIEAEDNDGAVSDISNLVSPKKGLQTMEAGTDRYNDALKAIQDGRMDSVEDVQKYYNLTKDAYDGLKNVGE